MGWPITIESYSWIDFISVAYASWYHWNCGRTQRKVATINQLACPSYCLYVQLLWYPMYYPEGVKARVSPVQWSKPHSILPPLRFRTRVVGFRIISGDHYTTTAHSRVRAMTIDPKKSPEVKIILVIQTTNYDFLTDFSWHKSHNLSISYDMTLWPILIRCFPEHNF